MPKQQPLEQCLDFSIHLSRQRQSSKNFVVCEKSNVETKHRAQWLIKAHSFQSTTSCRQILQSTKSLYSCTIDLEWSWGALPFKLCKYGKNTKLDWKKTPWLLSCHQYVKKRHKHAFSKAHLHRQGDSSTNTQQPTQELKWTVVRQKSVSLKSYTELSG